MKTLTKLTAALVLTLGLLGSAAPAHAVYCTELKAWQWWTTNYYAYSCNKYNGYNDFVASYFVAGHDSDIYEGTQTSCSATACTYDVKHTSAPYIHIDWPGIHAYTLVCHCGDSNICEYF